MFFIDKCHFLPWRKYRNFEKNETIKIKHNNKKIPTTVYTHTYSIVLELITLLFRMVLKI